MLEIELYTAIGWLRVLELALLGACVGVMAGLFGVGGGFLLTPLLNVLFRVPYHVAVGSSLAQMSVMGAVGAWRHWSLGHVDGRLGGLLVVGGLLGAESGVRVQGLLRKLPDVRFGDVSMPGFDFGMSLLFIALLLSIGGGMWVESGRAKRRAAGASARANAEEAAAAEWTRKPSAWAPVGLGFCTGILTGVMGTGGGILVMPALMYVLGAPTLVAVGTSSLMAASSALYGSVRYVMLGDVDARLVIVLLVGSVSGVWAGARFSRQIKDAALRRAFATVVLATAVLVGWRLLGAAFGIS